MPGHRWVAKFQIKINIMQISSVAITLDNVAGRCRSQTILPPTKESIRGRRMLAMRSSGLEPAAVGEERQTFYAN